MSGNVKWSVVLSLNIMSYKLRHLCKEGLGSHSLMCFGSSEILQSTSILPNQIIILIPQPIDFAYDCKAVIQNLDKCFGITRMYVYGTSDKFKPVVKRNWEYKRAARCRVHSFAGRSLGQTYSLTSQGSLYNMSGRHFIGVVFVFICWLQHVSSFITA